ncbi:hypothetical protein B5M42_009530 [Paenibacillus athensensis]|uniref:CBS domain-containing protein n=1 Tax=Paenibacillus athensensis TaxID=1967502 RepID=A0A4Y8Q9K0_9BACL|nr:DUF294 nucleotidyltransferase-like domain-containing protein [Paenibacillus athensensis]MCD1259077.1 hypothetical protein [Paenibacillus athensensis]
MNHLSMEQILARITQSERFDEMRMIRDQVHEMLREHLLFAHSLGLSRDINRIHDALIHRAAALTEAELAREGRSCPPVRFALMLFGSGGRCEQTLWSDQDNGFIYEDVPEEEREEVESYFAEFVGRLLSGLEALGYPPCEGNVVANNPQWRKPVSAYIAMALDWLAEPNWENMRYLLIMADMRCIYGEPELVERLRGAVLAYVREHVSVLQQLLSNTLHHKISLGVFGHLITERYGEDAGGFDVKYGAYIPIVNGIRLLAIQEGIAESTTLRRLEGLVAAGVLGAAEAQTWRQAFEIALKHRDMTPFTIDNGMYTTRSKLSAEQLTRELKQELKFCLRAGMELQKFVRKSVEAKLHQREKG